MRASMAKGRTGWVDARFTGVPTLLFHAKAYAKAVMRSSMTNLRGSGRDKGWRRFMGVSAVLFPAKAYPIADMSNKDASGY